MKPTAQWRTFLGELAIGGMMLIALVLCPAESRAGVAPTVVAGLGGLGLWLAGKSAVQHATTAKLAPEVKP